MGQNKRNDFIYKCDCKNTARSRGVRRMTITKVDAQHVCLSCGYYAMAELISHASERFPIRGSGGYMKAPVTVFKLDTFSKVGSYESYTKAAIAIGVASAMISQFFHGRSMQAKGYIFVKGLDNEIPISHLIKMSKSWKHKKIMRSKISILKERM